MKMHMGYASVSIAGDYYQVMFEEKVSNEEQDSMKDLVPGNGN